MGAMGPSKEQCKSAQAMRSAPSRAKLAVIANEEVQMSLEKTNLGGMPKDERGLLAHCVKLLLLWVAASDGNVDDSELEFADSKFPSVGDEPTTADLLAVIRVADARSLEMAVRVIAGQNRELRTAFLDMAITMAIADRELAISENHILRFYADALYLGGNILQKRTRAITGSELPDPGDPGDPQWWGDSESKTHLTTQSSERSGMTLAQARTMFCIERDATQREVESAYRNLSALFQTKRFEDMGDAAIAVANKRLERIEEAYELLRNDHS